MAVLVSHVQELTVEVDEYKQENRKLKRRLAQAERDADEAEAEREQAEDRLQEVEEQLTEEHEYAERLEAEMAEEDALAEEEEEQKEAERKDESFSIDTPRNGEAKTGEVSNREARRESTDAAEKNPLFAILHEANAENPIAFSDQHAAFKLGPESPDFSTVRTDSLPPLPPSGGKASINSPPRKVDVQELGPASPSRGFTAGITRMVRGFTPSPSPIRRKSGRGSNYNMFDRSPDQKKTGEGNTTPHQAIV
jgi:hypothetical protein